MCMALCIGPDQPLSEIPWVEANPPFRVIAAARDHAARDRFRTPHVYDVGSHDGCACGFQLVQYPQFEDEGAPLTRRSLAELATCLEDCLSEGGQIELFACRIGDEFGEPASRSVLSPQALRGEPDFFREREMLRLAQHA